MDGLGLFCFSVHLLFYLNSDSLFRYQFNKDKMAISLPFPLGGKKSEELNIPNTLSVPLIDLPALGLYIPPRVYPLPRFTIPPSLDLSLPLLGLAEASTKISSNFYSWEGSFSGGNNTADVPSYTVLYKAMAHSPFSLLSYKLEGKYLLEPSFKNMAYLLTSLWKDEIWHWVHHLVFTDLILIFVKMIISVAPKKLWPNLDYAWS